MEVWKELLFGLKFQRVHATPAAAQLYWMLQVQHLVINDVLHRIPRHVRMVEYSADYDRVVRRIIVSQTVARVILAPGEMWPRQQPKEKSCVQVLKKLVQVVH